MNFTAEDLAAFDFPALHDRALAEWYAEGEAPDFGPSEVEPAADVESVVLAQHFSNFKLWNLEDEARRRDVADAYIAEIKRAIDARNQRRNDLIEVLDERLLDGLAGVDVSGAERHSETAGMIVDRLSILSLKVHHMAINASRTDDKDLAAECAKKLAVLSRQRTDLARCVAKLLADFAEGRRYFELYRQYKAYNDQRLNPALAGRGTRG